MKKIKPATLQKPGFFFKHRKINAFLFFYFVFIHFKRYPSTTIVDNASGWTSVSLDTDLSFGTIRSTEVSMMANIKKEFEKLSRIGKGKSLFTGFQLNILCTCFIYLFSYFPTL